MSPEIGKLLTDILKSIDTIEAHLQNVLSLSVYRDNIMVKDAVERRLAIIGEALWKADKLDKTLNISSKNKIISLRHIIVHDYDIVEDSAIWIIYKKHLPVLKNEIQTILDTSKNNIIG